MLIVSKTHAVKLLLKNWIVIISCISKIMFFKRKKLQSVSQKPAIFDKANLKLYQKNCYNTSHFVQNPLYKKKNLQVKTYKLKTSILKTINFYKRQF